MYPAYIVSVSGTDFTVVIRKKTLFNSLGQIFRTYNPGINMADKIILCSIRKSWDLTCIEVRKILVRVLLHNKFFPSVFHNKMENSDGEKCVLAEIWRSG